MDVGVVVGLMACCFELCRRPARREMGMVDFTLREFPNVVYALFLEKGSPDVIVDLSVVDQEDYCSLKVEPLHKYSGLVVPHSTAEVPVLEGREVIANNVQGAFQQGRESAFKTKRLSFYLE